jgi:type IV secretory pathway VirD2 relaxase
MQRLVLLAAAATVTAFCASAVAQGATKPAAPRTAASLECSKQADAKGLHGKQRKSFRAKCKRDFEKTARGKS